MAAKVVPQSELEREVAELLKGGAGEVERAQMDALEAGAEVDEAGAEERRERLMRMRHLMFQHEMKQKRVRKIKSKDYHRRLKKKEKRLREEEGEGADGLEGTLDLEGEREAREAAEYARAEERLTLRHKNTSRWARRALKRGMANMDDGMKKALGEQLRLNEALRKKVEMAGSDSDSDSEDDGGSSDEGGEGGGGKRTARAQAKVLRELEEDPDATLPEKGLFSLPFMKRAINRKRQAVQDEAQRLAQELGQRASDSEDDEGGVDGAMDWGEGEVAGEDGKEPVARRTFGPGGVKRGRVPLPAGGDGEGEDDAFEGSSGSEDEKETPQPSLKRKALAKNRVKLEGQKLQPRGKVMATAGPFSVEVPPAEPLSRRSVTIWRSSATVQESLSSSSMGSNWWSALNLNSITAMPTA